MNINKLVGAVGVAVLLVALSACSGESAGSSRESTATGEPIKVGFLNQGAGALAFPDFAAGANAAVVEINANGGIDGRPLELVTCNTDGTPAASVKCANQFVDDELVAVVQGIDLSSDTALPILAGAGIPFVGHAQFGVDQTNSPDAFFFGAAQGAYYGVPLETLAEGYGAERIAFLNVDTPGTRAIADANLDPVAEALDVEVKKVFYSPTSPNYTSAFASAVADDPDAVLIVASDADCTGLVQAGRSLGYEGTIFAGSCSQFVTADPASAEGVLTDTDVYLPDDTSGVPAEVADQVSTYQKAMEGEPAEHVNVFSQMTFSGIMDLADVIRSIDGDITPAAVKSSLAGVREFASFMGQTVTCDGKRWPEAISVCASGLLVYEVRDGKRQLVSDGFVDVASYYEG